VARTYYAAKREGGITVAKRTGEKTVLRSRPGPQPSDIITGGDDLKHYAACGHADVNPHKSHADGIAAHVAIYLKPCVDIWEAYHAILKIKAVDGLTVEKVHVSLGEIDMLADIHAAWTDTIGHPHPHSRGGETRLLGDWVNSVRQLKPKGHSDHSGTCDCCFVARTSTNVCMVPD
jgi:hypothetical protein